MIGNVTMGNYFGGALSYIYKVGKDLPENKRPVQIETNNVVGSPKQMAWQMVEHAQNSRRLQKPVLHISVSFAPEDNLTQAKEVEAVKAFIQYFGITEEKYQYVIVKHFDSDNSHYHIVANKLNLENNSLNVDWYKNDAVGIADRVEQENNLFRVQGRSRIFDIVKGMYRNVTKEERAKIIESRQLKVFRDKPLDLNEYQTNIRNSIDIVSGYTTNLDELKTELAKVNIQATFRIDAETGMFKGASFRYDKKIRVKGSEVGFSANVINQRLKENKEIIEVKTLAEDVPLQNGPEFIRFGQPKCNNYNYIDLGNDKVIIMKQSYFESDKENERLTKLYIDDAIELRVMQKNIPDLKVRTSYSKNRIDLIKAPIETERIQTNISSNDLEELKDVIITQENASDFNDNSIADVDKKTKPTIKRRKMRM